MAKYEKQWVGDFDEVLNKIEKGVASSSVTVTLEDQSDIQTGNCRLAVRVYERYSYSGGNRCSLNITLFTPGDGLLYLTGISAGGSEAVFFKLNTLGEEAFLNKLKEIIEK